MKKLYTYQNPMKLGKFYTDHVLAMTVEGLHSKSDIAKQLAWRDMQIEALREFAIEVFNNFNDPDTDQSGHLLFKHNLMLKSGSPTKLLTGE